MERYKRIQVVLVVSAIMAVCPLAWAKYGGGSGTVSDPYLIYTPEQMDAMASDWRDWDKCFKLMADIDMGGYSGTQYHIIGINWQGGFAGVFDGNGKTISHFTYACADANCIGLFGLVSDNARISNLGLIDPNVSAVRGYYVGSLAGECRGIVTNCYVTNAAISGKYHVGGLFGSAGKLSNCHATGTVTGVHNVGGLAGYVWETVTCCSATAKVTGTTEVGGLTGWNNGRLGGCFSAGSVVGDRGVGGLVGTDDLVISNCYSICDVNATDQVGGLVGGRAWDCMTANSYSAGKVRGTLHTGGLIGMDCALLVGIPDTIKACFWDTQVSGRTTSDGGTGLSTARMQTAATFLGAGWDFTGETANGVSDLWQMPGKRSYPKLSWERIPVEEPNTVEPELPADDFEDGQAAPQWTACESADGLVRVQEVDGRLDVLAGAPTDESIAFYVSDGWRLDATEDFEVKIDFHFSKSGVGQAKVLIGVTPNPTQPVSQWIAMEAGCFNRKPFHQGEFRDGYSVQTWPSERSGNDGTLYMSYDSLVDELYLSNTGYGQANAKQTVTGVLKGLWHTESVRIILGGASTSMVLKAGEAWLDNFAVDSGVIVQ